MGQVIAIFVVNFFLMLREFYNNMRKHLRELIKWNAKRKAKQFPLKRLNAIISF